MRDKYRCPECGSENIRSDVEMATMANPNDDIHNDPDHWLSKARIDLSWEWSRDGNGYTECLDCDEDGDMEEFRVQS